MGKIDPITFHLSRIRGTPILIGLLRLGALQLSGSSQIKAFICFVYSVCAVTEVQTLAFPGESHTQRCISRQPSNEADKQL